MLRYRKLGIPHALRLSEFETDQAWNSDWLIIDSFDYDWWLNKGDILELIQTRKCLIISPELHNRNPEPSWNYVAQEITSGNPFVALCTDFPLKFLDIL